MLYMTSDVAILAESYSEVIVSIVAQSVLKIGFVLAKNVGWGGGVGGFQRGMPCTWQLPWLAVESIGLSISLLFGSCLGWL